MSIRPRNSKGDIMVHRSSLLLGAIFAMVLALVTAVPVLGYGHANDLHLRISRVGAISCSQSFQLGAKLTNNRGRPVAGVSIHFAIAHGAPLDTVLPANVVTNIRGNALTSVTLDCSKNAHQIVATAPNNAAAARITLLTVPAHFGALAGSGAAVVSPGTTGSSTLGSQGLAVVPTMAAAPPISVASFGFDPLAAGPAGLLMLAVLVLLALYMRRLSALNRTTTTH